MALFRRGVLAECRVPQRAKICGVQSEKDSNESGQEERVKTPVLGLVLGKSAEEEVESRAFS